MAHSASRRIPRDDLLAIARADDPWKAAPLCLQALAQTPGDAPLALLGVGVFLKLGLRQAAEEILDRLPPGAPEGDVEALRAAVAALPEGRAPLSQRLSTLRANLEALGERAVGLHELLDAWRRRGEGIEVLRARDGNIAIREAKSGRWIRLRDDLGEARALKLPFTGGARAQDASAPGPIVIEGADPPFLLQRLIRETPPADDGYCPRLTLVQRDPMELLDGLSVIDLREELRDSRLELLFGEDAGERLASGLESRFDLDIKSLCVTLSTTRSRLTPSPAEICERAQRGQSAALEELRRETDARYAGRDGGFWSARLRHALEGDGPPLRVLIPTSRYTTFVRHSAADLEAAFRAFGCETRVLVEPDDHSRLSALAFRRAFAEFEPDLVVLINFTRANLGGACPADVPFVCWAQDAMGHLFDERIGRAHGPLDFLVGNVNRALTEHFHYPSERVLRTPVVASDRRFTPMARRDVEQELRCDIAYVSHQSEPVERMRDRLAMASAHAPEARAAIQALLPEIERLVAESAERPVSTELERIVRETLEGVLGRAPEEELCSLVLTQAAFPLADRVIRHEMIGWAAELADEHGWTLRLYGRGWERHPRFGKFAAGEAIYGEELRRRYAGAVVHLHTSINALAHQRLLECAFSGGVPLVRLHGDELSRMQASAMVVAMRRGPIHIAPRGARYLSVVEHPELVGWCRTKQVLGLKPMGGGTLVRERLLENIHLHQFMEDSALEMLVDPLETGFVSRETLEQRVRRLRESDARRRSVSAMIARSALERHTHDAFVRRLLDFVRSKLPTPEMEAAA